MFRDGLITENAEIIPERELIASIGLIVMDSPVGRDLFKPRNRNEIMNQGLESVEDYKNLPWRECIPQTFLMSQFDSIHRNLILYPIQELSDEEVRGLEKYFCNIEDWLKKDFDQARRVVLNPVYSIRDLCAADADLIIDDTLYDIKTTTRPEEVRKDKNQVLGYVSLAWHHKVHTLEKSPPVVEFHHGGFLLPLSLRSVEFPLDSFTQKRKEDFCSRLEELRTFRTKNDKH
jgi:hypothetical protein